MHLLFPQIVSHLPVRIFDGSLTLWIPAVQEGLGVASVVLPAAVNCFPFYQSELVSGAVVEIVHILVRQWFEARAPDPVGIIPAIFPDVIILAK